MYVLYNVCSISYLHTKSPDTLRLFTNRQYLFRTLPLASASSEWKIGGICVKRSELLPDCSWLFNQVTNEVPGVETYYGLLPKRELRYVPCSIDTVYYIRLCQFGRYLHISSHPKCYGHVKDFR